MIHRFRLAAASVLAIVLVVGLVGAGGPAHAAGDNWPAFRGPAARGFADGHPLPPSWDVQSGRNVAWSVEVPGLSHASPIVWDNRVYVVTAVATDTSADRRDTALGNDTLNDTYERVWKILALDRTDGTLLWEHEAFSGQPRVSRHEKGTQANSTPATDGRYVVAVYASEGMVVYDMDGAVLWTKDLGRLDSGLWGDPSTPWGHGSSPVIWEDVVVIQSDTYDDSFLAALALADGTEVWRVARAEKNTWSTPTVHDDGTTAQVITNGGNFFRSYDMRTGEELWSYADEAQVKVPTPVVTGDLAILSGGWPQGRPIHAVELSSRGAVGSSPGAAGLRWRIDSGGPYTATPLAYRGLLYNVTDTGILSAYDLATGERLHRTRLGGAFSASPVAGDGKVYLASEDGEVVVLEAGGAFAELARIDMGEPLFASPAIADGQLFIRGRTRLVMVAGD